jgi:hypothetical protein
MIFIIFQMYLLIHVHYYLKFKLLYLWIELIKLIIITFLLIIFIIKCKLFRCKILQCFK